MKKGLKQRELAEALYLSDSFIAKLESITHQTISIDTLEEIAEVLDCDIRDFFDKDIAVDGNTNNYFIIQKGCFVYNPRKSNTAPYGPFNCYQGEEEGIISPLYTCLVKKSDVDSTYLSWYFKSDSWYRYIYDNGSQGVRHDRVSMTDDLLMGIPIKLPNGERQKEIGAFFDAIDAKLKCETDILNALIKIKNGLYDKMFI